MPHNASFELSRVYASGWTAGNKWANTDPDDIQGVSDRLNPYQGSVERERWEQGFKDSISRFSIRTAPGAGKTKSKAQHVK